MPRHNNNREESNPPFLAYSGPAPGWLAKCNIFTLEILAAVIAIAQLSELHARGLTLIFIDNTAAASALIRGSTEDPTARMLIESFWKICRKSKNNALY